MGHFMIRVNRKDNLDWQDGMTVQDVLDCLGYEFSLLTVFVNGVLVDEDEYDQFVIPDHADVRALHLHHGG